MILKDKEIAKTFNDCDRSVADNLDLYHWKDKTSSPSDTSDKINNISKDYEKY